MNTLRTLKSCFMAALMVTARALVAARRQRPRHWRGLLVHQPPRAPGLIARRGALEDGDVHLAEAVTALRDRRASAARDLVALARGCYADVADAARRQDREDLVAALEAQLDAVEATAAAVRAEARAALDAKRKAAPSTDTAGDRLVREAAAALGRREYAGAREAIEAARDAFARDRVTGREEQLGSLFASVNIEEERAARDAARRERDRAEQAEELLRRGKAHIADQRILEKGL
mmetsp:Transcript_4999/g.14814  ORF Transcript_4999/g.14814 Transcript_4999/m.14814 type:complete len:235 (-) Transcript_4999:95-799(-)|eukprot:CAMPEP_0119279346 /NCGR_PEP_ID=MMETSP1329-20130426/20632_1 /TAXON_ID=114041 /ORGANISM="Genus nov. species nov., Strain RCC1024" /LENGTH=234 /DNA_ID=CAMNT_0007279883 /DNA_START=395 /DNA_END=1099 /DNA_ORIENTATION=+